VQCIFYRNFSPVNTCWWSVGIDSKVKGIVRTAHRHLTWMDMQPHSK
jgi:hypothetical protein